MFSDETGKRRLTAALSPVVSDRKVKHYRRVIPQRKWQIEFFNAKYGILASRSANIPP